ncbi:MAG: HAD-IA family hydrolase [Cyanothece sp. SIO1E1]|nr:HAD-IA family hydrolase [Cyanothece sp. SIO1E1]
MAAFQKITHVIYDLDGLLLDTESINAQVNQAIASRYDKTFDATVKSKVAGRNALASARILVEMLELPLTPEEYVEERIVLTRQLFPAAQPMPGALTLTQHLHLHQIPQAVATSSARQQFDIKTSRHQDWFAQFECIVLGDDPAIKQGKPAPDSFLITAERLGAVPDQCLVFEDSLAGVTAACHAGMSVIAVPAPDMDQQLYQAADQVLQSLQDFEPELWQLPRF